MRNCSITYVKIFEEISELILVRLKVNVAHVGRERRNLGHHVQINVLLESPGRTGQHGSLVRGHDDVRAGILLLHHVGPIQLGVRLGARWCCLHLGVELFQGEHFSLPLFDFRCK